MAKREYTANTITQEARRELAQAIGEDAGTIRIEMPNWTRLMQMGVIVRLHLRRWRASGKMTLEDLGIRIADAEERTLWQEYLTLGCKKLLPAKILNELDSIDVTARNILNAYSFETSWGRFVPCTAYPRWKAETEAIRERYYAKRDEIIEQYDDLVGQARAAYVVAGQRAWERLSAQGSEPPLPLAEYGQQFAARVMAAVPDRESIAESFEFSYDLSYIPLPSLLSPEVAAEKLLQNARLQADLEIQENRVEQERQREQAETNLTLSAAEYRDKLMRDMQADVLAKARQEREALIGGFWTDVKADLHRRMYSILTSVLGTMQRNDGKLMARSVVQLKGLVESIGALNFTGDEGLERQIGQIRGMLDTEADERCTEDIQATLQEISASARQTLIDLGERPRAGRALSIDDVGAVEPVRRARGELGDVDVPAIEGGRRGRSAA